MEELLKLNARYMEQNIELWEKIGMLTVHIEWLEARLDYDRGQRTGNAPCKVVRLQPKA